MEHSSRLLQHGSKRWRRDTAAAWHSKPPSDNGASPIRAAEMLPTVTDMFNQCRKVRSLAAGKRETQVKLLHAWQQRQGQLLGAGGGRDQGRHLMAPHAAWTHGQDMVETEAACGAAGCAACQITSNFPAIAAGTGTIAHCHSPKKACNAAETGIMTPAGRAVQAPTSLAVRTLLAGRPQHAIVAVRNSQA